MCGIIGYSGSGDAKEIISNGLFALEYRGYDSAGMTLFTSNGLFTLKSTGRVGKLCEKLNASENISSNCGIGHTRWATHGGVTKENAHPHGNDMLMLVHNGIIENYEEIKNTVLDDCEFYSQTDTEVIAKLLSKYYLFYGDKMRSIRELTNVLKGSYAVAVVFADEKDTVYALKKDSPLLLGIGKNGNYVASDITAFSAYADEYIRLNDGESVRLTPYSAEIYSLDGCFVQKQAVPISKSSGETGKNGYSHYMLKEIYEQSSVLDNELHTLYKNGNTDFSEYGMDDEFFKSIRTVRIIACGTAMHSGLSGKYFIEKYARIPVTVEVASEFRYSNPIFADNELDIIISQSGETADSLASLRLINKSGVKTLGIVNSPLSSIASESLYTVDIKAGTEIAVASTKAFTAQTLVLLLLALKLGEKALGEYKIKEITENCEKCFRRSLPMLFSENGEIKKASKIISKHSSVFFIGRGADSHLCKEASLKLKEISYINSQSYEAGELKHGTISLIENGTPVVALACDERLSEKMKSNIQEVRARGAFVIAVCGKDNENIKNSADMVISLPDKTMPAAVFSCSAAIQLLAYYTALELDRDIDKPRNLAKSVTVE